MEKIQLESVIKLSGKVVERSKDTINPELQTGEIEIVINSFEILGQCKELPMPVFTDQEYSEEIRLKYRFLDLRRESMQNKLNLRHKVTRFIWDDLSSKGFTHIETSSSETANEVKILPPVPPVEKLILLIESCHHRCFVPRKNCPKKWEEYKSKKRIIK